MKYLYLDIMKESILVRFSTYEIKVISNIITEVLHIIPVHSFQTRLGYYREEVSYFLSRVKQDQCKVLSSSEHVEVEISEDDLRILNNSFNEVCHGVKIGDFNEVVGIDKASLKDMFEELRTLYQYFPQ